MWAYLIVFIFGAAASGAWPTAETWWKTPRDFFVRIFEWFGELGIFCARLVKRAAAPPYEIGELIRQCDNVGSKSLPLVALAGAAGC